MMFEAKFIFGIISGVLAIASFIPYIYDIFRGKTKPHLFTYLVWFITESTAVAAIWVAGGGFGLIGPLLTLVGVIVVLLLGVKYRTKNVKVVDYIALFAALAGIATWWITDNPLYSVIVVSLVDLFGYIPTFRKTYEEPWTETVLTWSMAALALIFALLAIEEYSLVTVLYLATLLLCDVIIVSISYIRRPLVTPNYK